MSSITLASKTFTSIDQNLFAKLTGDFNPIHIDAIAARRTQAGSIVVHGIHALLWALEKIVEMGAGKEEIASLRVQFTNFIYVGSQADLKLLGRDEKSIRAALVVDTLTTTNLIITLGARKGTEGIELPSAAPRMHLANEPEDFVRLEELSALNGWLDVTDPVDAIQRYFPYASSAIGGFRVAGIALLSTLVGMICPGRHSLFAGLTIDLVDQHRNQNRIGFQVSGTDERFRMVRMSVTGAGVCGSVQAFLRWPPISQAQLSDIMNIVAPTEFAGSTALIIGGSRGLGALTAKILAAGGGRVIVTYATGRADAEELTAEIRSQTTSDTCHALQYDIHLDAAAQLKELRAHVSHLYYFATSNIARQKSGVFVMALFDEFLEMYVNGFYECCRYLEEHGSQALTAFYPSSVFVEHTPSAMIEYSMAKMAGEMLCASMNRAGGRVHTVVSRLPRLLTDQTATVLPMDRGHPLKVMLPVIRAVQLSRTG
jgi:NAD(P)-dependent dehydrogenase (short-subunit alcohol dehydrogenase family)